MKRGHAWIAFAFILSGLVFSQLFCTGAKKEPPEETGISYLNHHDTVNYVGIDACKGCHADKYATFIRTGMGQSFDTASRSKSAAAFSGHDLVYDPYSGYYYHPYWKDGTLWIREFKLDGKDTVHNRAEKVSYIIGSGQHTNSHIISINGYLYQAPFTWYAQEKKWDLPPGFDQGHNSRFQRIIGLECMSCHNAIPAFTAGSENRFDQVPKGIDCERCHGPGELHVNLKKQGILVDTRKEIDYSIVNPRKLPWKLQIDVCQRCHLQGDAVVKEGKQFTDFRPGMPLSSVFDVYVPAVQDASDPFIMASHAERLQLSPCFKGSNTAGEESKESPGMKLTCITCHNPHVSVKETGKQVFNNACISCHPGPDGYRDDACKESRQERMKAGDNCVQCHMPGSGASDIPHVAIHDHYIRRPVSGKKEGTVNTGLRLTPANRKQVPADNMAKAYLSYYEKFEAKAPLLDSAAYHLDRAGNKNTGSLIHLAYLRNDFNEVGRLAAALEREKVTDAWTAYRIGQSLYNTGDYLKAELWFDKAWRLSPYSLEFGTKLGVVLMQNNKTENAITTFKKVLGMQPEYISALTNLGFAYQSSARPGLAKRCYEDALALDAFNEPALKNMVDLYNSLGDRANCLKYLERLAKVRPKDQVVQDMIRQLKK